MPNPYYPSLIQVCQPGGELDQLQHDVENASTALAQRETNQRMFNVVANLLYHVVSLTEELIRLRVLLRSLRGRSILRLRVRLRGLRKRGSSVLRLRVLLRDLKVLLWGLRERGRRVLRLRVLLRSLRVRLRSLKVNSVLRLRLLLWGLRERTRRDLRHERRVSESSKKS